MYSKNYPSVIIILIITTIIIFISVFFKIESLESVEISNFPVKIGEWRLSEILISNDEYVLEKDGRVIRRNYTNNEGTVITLYISYSKNSRKVIKPPEIGLMGEGETITSKSDIRITSSLIATKINIEKKDSKVLSVYWYKIGKFYTRSYVKQQVNLLLDQILFKKTGIAVIMVSTQVKEKSAELALNNIKRFCNLIEPLLERYIP